MDLYISQTDLVKHVFIYKVITILLIQFKSFNINIHLSFLLYFSFNLMNNLYVILDNDYSFYSRLNSFNSDY
jgi:hypothetical protein